jgi:hypothetical protein
MRAYVCVCVYIWIYKYADSYKFIQDPDPELSEKSDPGSDPKKIIPDPQHWVNVCRNFTEGWVEFLSKKVARRVADQLNNTQGKNQQCIPPPSVVEPEPKLNCLPEQDPKLRIVAPALFYLP